MIEETKSHLKRNVENGKSWSAKVLDELNTAPELCLFLEIKNIRPKALFEIELGRLSQNLLEEFESAESPEKAMIDALKLAKHHRNLLGASDALEHLLFARWIEFLK